MNLFLLIMKKSSSSQIFILPFFTSIRIVLFEHFSSLSKLHSRFTQPIPILKIRGIHVTYSAFQYSSTHSLNFLNLDLLESVARIMKSKCLVEFYQYMTSDICLYRQVKKSLHISKGDWLPLLHGIVLCVCDFRLLGIFFLI